MSVVGERLQPTLFERSRPGRGGDKIPHPPKDALDRLPAAARRKTAPALPEINEPEVVRHYVNLSQLNYAIDTGFYPLGSCTMKFNPKLNEWAARLPGFATLHPLAPDEVAQGTLQLLWELEGILAEISGMKAVTLQPAAGAQGELCGILMIRAYHRSRGDTERDEVLVPDSSHGTNPATATMAGFRTITIPSAADGGVDVDAFRAALGPRTAAVMITNPSTLGLFERRIGDLLDAVHEAGALAYMDGANLNAILGRFRPGEAGFDVMHFNLHKTFSTPHGGGGPGMGPIGVASHLAPFLPGHSVVATGGSTNGVLHLKSGLTYIGDQRLVGQDARPADLGRHRRREDPVAVGEAEHGLEAGEPIGAAEVHRVAVEREPGAQGQRLRDDREVHAADPATEREVAEREAEDGGHQDDRRQREGAGVERLPEQREFRHPIPHHEVGERALIDALRADLEHEVHPHRVGTQTEEHAVAETQHAGIAPQEVQTESEDGVRQELAEEVEGEVRQIERRARRQRVTQGQPDDEQEPDGSWFGRTS